MPNSNSLRGRRAPKGVLRRLIRMVFEFFPVLLPVALVCILIIFLAGLVEIMRFYRTDKMVGNFLRIAILLYALNLFRISASMLYRKVKENRELERRLRRSRAELMASQIRTAPMTYITICCGVIDVMPEIKKSI